MGSKKKDLEIIYNLQWKNQPANGGDKANMIGMYDIPATTLNWHIFKSYLLKNSGTVGDDVKVSYITDNNREFPIESQAEFQIALYAFRRKARMGDIVNLKLDRIADQYKNSRPSNDVETQFDNNEAASLVSTCCNTDTPPDWFVTYMSEFKKTITEELTATVSGIVSNMKPHVVSQPSGYHTRKTKSECPKRVRKQTVGELSHDTKEWIRSLKLEGKFDRKLEKLEHKTNKLKEKRLALLTKSSDIDAGPSSSASQLYRDLFEDDCDTRKINLKLDAAPVNIQTQIPHMLGGETYLHQWQVRNTGQLPWTDETLLHFTWGSKALKPLDIIISVPFLKPGEIGTVAGRLQIPHAPGHYECYYHFRHRNIRFGHWLGCQVIVDPFDLRGTNSVLETSFASEFILNPNKNMDGNQRFSDHQEIWGCPSSSNTAIYTSDIEQKITHERKPIIDSEDVDAELSGENEFADMVRNITDRVEDMKLEEPTDNNSSNDSSDGQSIVSLSESCSSKTLPEEYVLVHNSATLESVPNLPTESTQQEQNVAGSDVVTDSVSNGLTAGNVKQTKEEGVESCSEQASDNYDNNNNTEETNQNCTSSGSSNKIDDISSNDGSHKSDDIVIISLPNEKDQDNTGYAYVLVDGQKLQIPKKILKSEYLMTAEEATCSKNNLSRTSSATSSVEIVGKEEVNSDDSKHSHHPEDAVNTEEEMPELESVYVSDEENNTPVASLQTNVVSEANVVVESDYESTHCSAAGSTFSDVNSLAAEKASRFFIFPQSRPGFEVVYPVLDAPENFGLAENGTEVDTHYAYSAADVPPLQPVYQNTTPSAPVQLVTSANSPPLNLSTHDRNPFISSGTVHVPNYQQTPPNMRNLPESTGIFTTAGNVNPPSTQSAFGARTSTPEPVRIPETAASIHILPETLVTGAVNVASSAINTARSVINMIVPREQPGRWVNGHWVSSSSETPREGNLQALAEMGFWNRDLNATLLARYNDDLSRVVAELVQ